MRKLKIIAFFLSLLLLVQMMPVQQIGKALGQSQWTEELPHSDDCAAKAGNDCHPFNNPFLPSHHFVEINNISVVNAALAYIHFSEQIPHNHSTDIVSPPPDFSI